MRRLGGGNMLGNMSTDSKPLEQPSPTAPAQPIVHELSVAPEYVLGSLEFATPALTQIHKLTVTDYITGALIWGAITIELGRVHWGSAGGHPYAISPELEVKLIPQVEQYVIEKRATSDLTIMGTTVSLVNYARKLVEDAGVTAVADVTLIRKLIRPALKNIKRRAAAEKATSTG